MNKVVGKVCRLLLQQYVSKERDLPGCILKKSKAKKKENYNSNHNSRKSVEKGRINSCKNVWWWMVVDMVWLKNVYCLILLLREKLQLNLSKFLPTICYVIFYAILETNLVVPSTLLTLVYLFQNCGNHTDQKNSLSNRLFS